MIVDTSALFAYFVRSDPAHEVVARALENTEQRVVSPLVIAELDYLIAKRFGVDAELAALAELSSGAWQLADLQAEDIADMVHVIDQYRDQDVGATDASLVVLADRKGTREIATLDRRHFGVLRALDGKPFDVIPAL